MPDTDDSDVTISEGMRGIRTYAAWIILFVVVAALATYVLEDRQHKRFQANVLLQVSNQSVGSIVGGQNNQGVTQSAINDQLQVVGTQQWKRIVLEAAGLQNRTDVSLTASSIPTSFTIKISGTADDGISAAKAANTSAQLLVDHEATANSAAFSARARGLRTQANASTNTVVAQQLLQQAGEFDAEAAAAVSADSITTKADTPTSPSDPKPKDDAVLVGGVALIIACLLALWRWRSVNGRVVGQRADEFDSVPVLATIGIQPDDNCEVGAATARLTGVLLGITTSPNPAIALVPVSATLRLPTIEHVIAAESAALQVGPDGRSPLIVRGLDPASSLGGSIVLAARADATVVLVEPTSRRQTTAQVLRDLHAVGARVAGIVIVILPSARDRVRSQVQRPHNISN